MKFRAFIPNLFTLGNLICGSIVTVEVARGGYANAVVWLLFVAGFLDLLDGAVARALKVSGDLGKQLDSLADVVSFGLAPSVIIFSMLESALPFEWQWVKYLAFLNVACAALRLAKFNISTDQTHDFSGMPSPANGLFWASLALLTWQLDYDSPLPQSISTTGFTVTILFITSWLMVASVRMFSFKFKKGGYKANRIPYIYIAAVLALVIFILVSGRPILMTLPAALILYMALSFVYNYTLKRQ